MSRGLFSAVIAADGGLSSCMFPNTIKVARKDLGTYIIDLTNLDVNVVPAVFLQPIGEGSIAYIHSITPKQLIVFTAKRNKIQEMGWLMAENIFPEVCADCSFSIMISRH
jgi:hypothetical protein